MPAKVPFRRISLYEAKQKIAELFPNPLTWYQYQAVQNLSQFVPSQGLDSLSWTLTASGCFTVKSIYKILSQGGREYSDMVFLWRAVVTPSMRLFFFLLLRNRLLTHKVMARRNITHQQGYIMCDTNQIETAIHLFFTCPYAIRIWSAVLSLSGYPPLNVTDSLSQTFLDSIPANRDHRPKWIALFITTLWLLWRERNERTFRHNISPVFVLTTRIQHHADQCFTHCSTKLRT